LKFCGWKILPLPPHSPDFFCWIPIYSQRWNTTPKVSASIQWICSKWSNKNGYKLRTNVYPIKDLTYWRKCINRLRRPNHFIYTSRLGDYEKK
jgi:hypothetical protein